MNPHPYLRAFLAGVFIPTLVLPLILTLFIVVRLVLRFPVPIERGIIFPMALVPSLWGIWNMIWQLPSVRARLPLGVFGALLPVFMVPVGTLAGWLSGVLELGATGVVWFQVWHITYALIASGICIALAAYYLAWKYVVGFVNRTLGIE
ncbi:MAG TPA: hypothetical protein VG225_02380 [Terracidiphilus sp.]|jgi:hypothetical protein|nr:hypothetical protein [Terracidiphilus sp.]